MLHIALLGPLVVNDDEGLELTPAGARERNGLATLAVVAPDPLSTERLAAELYRERPTADPRNAVQAMVSRLRRALGRAAGVIETTANGYRLAEVTLDVDRAGRLLREAMAATDPTEADTLLGQARALWRGPTMDGLDGELVDNERLRIDGLRTDAEDAVLGRRAEGPAADPDLLVDLEAAVRAQPLRERRWELLMLALYRAGRQADALRAFQRARALLADHLGLDPGPTLTDLEARILAHDPGLAVSDPATRPGPPSGATASVGSGEGREAGSSLPAGTLSVLLCDVEGSVRRWEADPAETAAEIEGLHHRWRGAVEVRGGTVVKSTGDGILAVFPTADAAVMAAAGAMADQTDSSLAVRAAIHTGALTPVDGDYRGPVVNRCARLLDLSGGGQILVSGPTAELTRPGLAVPLGGDEDGPVGLRDLGHHWLRDVPEPMAIWQVTGPGLRASFPPLPSRDPTTLPRLRGRLLGRDDLVDRVTALVGDEALVTLLGPGGIGKTSTALAVAWRAVEGRPVTFVDLARVDDPEAVPERLAEALTTGHDEDDRDAVDRIADRLSTSTDLVVIDNAEHLLDSVATVVERVLDHQLKGTFLVTSRQPLGLADEVMVGVPPLEVPADDDDLTTTGRSPAVELFLARARVGRPEFRLPDGLLPVVAHICRRLDGIPLAIELAAGRSSLLSVDDIAARLDDQLRLLRQVRSQRERRHRSLEAVVRWSVDQLSPDARELFERASVMAGSFDLDGIESVLGHARTPPIDTLDAIEELDAASLITVETGGSRFRMLEPIRQFAAAELAARDQDLATRRAHAIWVTELAAASHEQRGRDRSRLLARLETERDQVLAALNWVADTGQSDLAGELAYPIGWWFLTTDARLGERILRRLLATVDADDDPLGWAQAVLGLGIATAAHPRSEVAANSLIAVEIFDRNDHPDRALARLAALFAQTAGNDFEVPLRLLAEADDLTDADDDFANALVDLSTVALRSLLVEFDPDLVDGPDLIGRGRRAIATFQELGETWALGTALAEQGRLLQRLGDDEAAEAFYVESLELFHGYDAHSCHYVLTELGRMASARGGHEQAAAYHAEALRIAELDGNDGCLALTMAGMAASAEARDDIDEAIRLYRQALDLMSDSIIELGRAEWQQALARLEDQTASQRDQPMA